jgi:uncharacterized protein YeaO (DUF488 family)
MAVRLKRAYEPAAAADGSRVLIDRIWPRGVSREQAQLDEWARELAPSSQLRRWFSHDPDRFAEFRRRYRAELAAQEAKLRELRQRARQGTLTLVYAARDTEHNDAVVLAELLRRGAKPKRDEKEDAWPST